jgi:hypothetical protein
MKRTGIFLIAISLFTFLGFSVQAAQLNISVSQTATIDLTNSDAGRLLFKFDLPQELSKGFIDYAELIFKSEPEPSSSNRVIISGFPLTKSWDEKSVSWTNPWTTGGGDYLDTIMATCLNPKQKTRLTSLDITEIVRMWVEEIIPNYGLILMDADRVDGKLKLQQSPKLPEGIKAQVRIFYTPRKIDKQ